MPRLTVQGEDYQIDAIVFDKDGTLIDLDHFWCTRARLGLSALASLAGRGLTLEQALHHSIGYDAQRDRAIPDGPLAVTTMSKLYTILAAILYQHGFRWEEAERMVLAAFAPPMVAPPAAEQIRPLADVASLFSGWNRAGLKIAVATSDDRAITMPTLAFLGVSDLVDAVVCGDDDLPNKPAPDAMIHLCELMAISPSKVMMVGDTISDMVFGRNAAVACCVGITDPNGDPAKFSGYADQVISDIGQIRAA